MIGTTAELICNVLSETDKHRYWIIVAELHRRGSSVEFDAAKALTSDPNPARRVLAANILGQLGHLQKTFQNESVRLFIVMLEDCDEDVIYAAACALGYRQDIAAVPFLITLIKHNNSDIRFGVTLGLSGIEDKEAIGGLIELSRDPDSNVRDWATFGLGSQCDFDSEELRAALLERILDENADVRAEALVGLATRSDKRVIKPIIGELKDDSSGVLVIQAAGLTGSPIFVPILKALRFQVSHLDKLFLSEIDEAIDSCTLKLVEDENILK